MPLNYSTKVATTISKFKEKYPLTYPEMAKLSLKLYYAPQLQSIDEDIDTDYICFVWSANHCVTDSSVIPQNIWNTCWRFHVWATTRNWQKWKAGIGPNQLGADIMCTSALYWHTFCLLNWLGCRQRSNSNFWAKLWPFGPMFCYMYGWNHSSSLWFVMKLTKGCQGILCCP